LIVIASTLSQLCASLFEIVHTAKSVLEYSRLT
jgi:hypothetical protein